jgi:hypothetical protein
LPKLILCCCHPCRLSHVVATKIMAPTKGISINFSIHTK